METEVFKDRRECYLCRISKRHTYLAEGQVNELGKTKYKVEKDGKIQSLSRNTKDLWSLNR